MIKLLLHYSIEDELYEIASECNELEWAIDDDETLIDVFDGDTDEIHEFRFMFSDLTAKCERLSEEIRDGYVTEHFDDFFVGALGSGYKTVGYDDVEEDYFNLTRFESELAQTVSGKRIAALKKDEIIAVAGQCIGIMMCFLDVRHQYACLKSTFDVLRDDRAELLKGVRTVEDVYQKWQANPDDTNIEREFDYLLSRLPGRAWIE